MNKSFLEEFINYSYQLFPNIDSSIKQSLSDALQQFDITKFNWFSSNDLGGINQGDILDNIPFVSQEENGKINIFQTKGMVISNSCDVDNDSEIILAPLIPYADSKYFNDNQKKDILNNKYYAKMCLSYSEIDNYYINLAGMQNFNKRFIIKLIEEKKIKLEYSLSQFGWYFLLTKLTIHFMRMEDHKLFVSRLRGA